MNAELRIHVYNKFYPFVHLLINKTKEKKKLERKGQFGFEFLLKKRKEKKRLEFIVCRP